MSKYAGGYPPNQTSPSFDQLDHTGTLFEGRVPVATQSVEERAPNNASTSLPQTTEQRAGKTYPELISQRQSSKIGVFVVARYEDDKAGDDERVSPHHELGGLITHSDRLAEAEHSREENLAHVLDAYQPWMRDVTLAVERYGLIDMTPDDVKQMTQSDKNILSLYVDGFMEGLSSIKQLISQFEGVAERHEFFDKYSKTSHKTPTPGEFMAYGQTLEALSQLIRQQSAAESLVAFAKKRKSSRDARAASRKNNKLTKKDTPRVYRDEAGKYRVELIPLSQDLSPPY